MNILSFFHGLLGWITAAWLAVILIVFAVAMFRFLTKSGRIIKDCDALNLPESEDELEKTPVGRLLQEKSAKETTDYAEDAINVSSIAASYKLNLRMAQSTPSILTSLGILGTFIGLSFSVLHFDSSSSESIRDSINSLLSGMGTAFFTSVFGMFFSVVFLWAERKRFNTLCNSVDALCDKVNKAYRRSSDQMVESKLQEITEQISGVQLSFGDNLDKVFDQKVTPVMSDIAKKLENPAQTVVDGLLTELRKVSDGFADKLTERVNNKMNELLDQFILATDEMKAVPAAINTATDNLIKSGETTIEAQKAFTKETKERFDKYTEDLTNAVKGQVGEIQKQFATTSTALKGIPEEISHSVEAQKSVTEEFTKQIEKLGTIEEIYSAAVDKITSANQDLADTKSNISTLTSKISAAATSIESASSGMVKSNEKMLKGFETIYDLNRDVTEQVNTYSERIKGIEGGLKSIFGEIEKGLTSYATTSSKNMQGLLDTFTNSVTDACQNISNATAPLHETIGGILKALDKTEKSAQALLKRVENLPQQKN